MDGSGNTYITGGTASNDFPTEGEYQLYQGTETVFVTKLSSSGNALIYSTYLGGSSGGEYAYDIVVDGSGNAYVTGETYSPDFPTEGEFQTYQGNGDAFVTKLNSSGNALVYSTYLGGGSNYDVSVGIAVDLSNSAYITGYTGSTDFPTEGEFQTYQGNDDAFVTKLNSSGNALVYSTYLEGSNTDEAWGIAVDGSGNAYITGSTRSPDFPTVGECQTYQGNGDAFVTKLNSSGNALVYSTYLGGSYGDAGEAIAVDSSGNSYITGGTSSNDFPLENAYQVLPVGGSFVTKLNSSGNALVYSTFLGGTGDIDFGMGIAVDGLGNVYVTGFTNSVDFPVKHEYQTYQGNYDAFVTKLNYSGNALIYSTYLGGADHDIPFGIAVDGFGNAYITGSTYSTNFPSVSEYQSDQSGVDAFVTKINCCAGNRGDLNGDGIGPGGNILDFVHLVDFIFRGSGDPGPCPEESDVNGDGNPANIIDLTYLVDFIFRGGPAPPEC